MGAIRKAFEKAADVIEAELDKLRALAAAAEEAEEAAEEEPDEEEEEPAPPKKTAKVGKKAKTYTMDQVRDALTALSKEHGKGAIVDILNRFGVSKLGDLPEENFAEAIELSTNYEAPEEPEEEADEEPAPPPKKRKKVPEPEPEPDEDEDEDEDADEDEDEDDEPAPPPKKRRK